MPTSAEPVSEFAPYLSALRDYLQDSTKPEALGGPPMNDDSRTIALPTIATFALWGGAIAFLLAAWIVAVTGPFHIAAMLGYTACVTTGMAAVFSIRCFANRTRSLIRTVHTLEDVRARLPELHPIH